MNDLMIQTSGRALPDDAPDGLLIETTAPQTNQTVHDAHERIAAARSGSMAGASDDYLCQLQRELLVWAGEITTELQHRIQKR